MAVKKQRRCKDCGTDDVIHKDTRERDLYNVETILCSACLHTRAQLQSMKEDKLSFPVLLKKIQGETNKRVKASIARDGYCEYKGINRYAVYGARSDNSGALKRDYWVEQLKIK